MSSSFKPLLFWISRFFTAYQIVSEIHSKFVLGFPDPHERGNEEPS